MLTINASGLTFRSLNERIRESGDPVTVSGCLGHRFIAAGMSDRHIELVGTPGNALGAYLNGAEITVRGNAQDAVGGTMNSGRIVIHGSIGDAAGYGMRGGELYVRGNAGYRAGIHMKEYEEKCPVIVVGGCCGSFLGEYQAGGLIVVLGLGGPGDIVGNYPCTGMHGGKMFLRSDCKNIRFPGNTSVSRASNADLSEIEQYVKEFCSLFDMDMDMVMSSLFTKIVPNSKNPYKQMYIAN
ncbi:MAG: glutamate synthase [Clostridiales bacterium]|nr:glutamate synthase [Clostridiales bacterium]